MKIETRKSVEDILAEKGLLNPDQVSAIKFEHINTGKPTENIVIDRGYATAVELTKARAELLNIPFMELNNLSIPSSVIELVPEPVAHKYRLIPFSKDAGILKVAMVDPLDLQVIEFIEKRAGVKVKPYIAEVDDIEKTIIEQYSKSLGTEVTAALEEAGEATKKLEEQLKNM